MAAKGLAKPLQRDTLTNTVIEEIKQMILEDRVKPGEWLPSQTELAQGFRVGLSTVREAIRGLALMGILDPQAGRGTQVTEEAPITLRVLQLVDTTKMGLDTHEVYETRRMIEVEMAGLAAERATEAHILEMEAAVQKLERVRSDPAEFASADMEFHLAVAQAAQNQLMTEYYQISRELLLAITRQVVEKPGVIDRGLYMHQMIVKSVRERDRKAARQFAKDSIEQWSEIVDTLWKDSAK